MSPLLWIFIAIVIINTALTLLRCKHFGISSAKAVILSVLYFVFVIIGAKILFFLEGHSVSINLKGGFSTFGGIIIMPPLMLPVCLFAKSSYGKTMDMLTPLCAIDLALLRVNCVIEGCCGAVPVYTDNGGCFIPPIQLCEVIVMCIYFALLLIAEYKGYVYVRGEQYPKLVIAYGFLRLVMEHYRDTWKHILGMSEGQWFAICTAAAAGIILAALRARKLKRPYNE